ncbi:MAG: penicillin-binding protein [Rhizobiales bacterium]|nr:penicillin-binding protein [Hyphomicrobiales bacterium]
MSAFVSALSPVAWIAAGVFFSLVFGFAGSGRRGRTFRRVYLVAVGLAALAFAGALAWFYRPASWWPILRDMAGDARGAAALLAAAVAGPWLGARIRRRYGPAPTLLALALAAPLLAGVAQAAEPHHAEAPTYRTIGAGEADAAARRAALRALVMSNQIVFTRRDGAVLPVCRCGPKLEADEVPRLLAEVLTATEDKRFYDHYGVDPIGVARAAFRLVTFRSVEGGSSLTQQLVKNALLSPERSLARKREEAALAQELEAAMSKREILAAYLNQASFGMARGREIIGAKQAALVFYGREIDELTLGEQAGLVALLRGPTLYSPTRNPARFEARRRLVLDVAQRAGVASAQEIAAARRAMRARGARAPQWPETRWFVEAATADLARRAPGFAQAPGARVAVSLVVDRQAALEQATARAGLAGDLELAAIAMGLDGRIVAAQGGRDYGATQFNRAVTMRRPAASTAKIFVYAAALAAGERVGAQTTQRFAESDNDFAVALARRVGAERVEAMARALGLASPMPIRDATNVALGANAVGLIELSGAMLPFAAQGAGARPYAAFALRGADGAMWAREAPGRAELPAGVAPAMRGLLRSVVTQGTARNAIRRLDFAAGKTGTGEDNRDGWFVGYTPRHVVGVWLGRDDNAPHPGLTGASAAALFDGIGAALAAQSGPPPQVALRAARATSSKRRVASSQEQARNGVSVVAKAPAKRVGAPPRREPGRFALWP